MAIFEIEIPKVAQVQRVLDATVFEGSTVAEARAHIEKIVQKYLKSRVRIWESDSNSTSFDRDFIELEIVAKS